MKKFIKYMFVIGFIVYMILLIYFLFFSEEYGRTSLNDGFQYNFKPFHEIKRYFHNIDRIGFTYFIINVFGNIVAFIPFGFLVPILYREQRDGVVYKGHYFRSFLNVLFLGATVSFVVEVTQLISKVGSFDVDDLILNTIGVIIGYLFYYFTKVILAKLQGYNKKGKKSNEFKKKKKKNKVHR